MRNRKILVLVFCSVAIPSATYLLFARTIRFATTSRCEKSTEPDALSPDGQQIATASMEACSVGLLSSTNPSIFVTLRRTAYPLGNPTLIFQLNDAVEAPTLTWTRGNELVVRLNDTGQVEVAKFEAQGVRIRYSVPIWIFERLGSIETTRSAREGDSKALYRSGKISEPDFRAMSQTDDAVAEEQKRFRQWVLANASVDKLAVENTGSRR